MTKRRTKTQVELFAFRVICISVGGPEKGLLCTTAVARRRIHHHHETRGAYLDDVYLVTALVPSLTACLANSPGNKRRTAVWISRLVIVERRL